MSNFEYNCSRDKGADVVMYKYLFQNVFYNFIIYYLTK